MTLAQGEAEWALVMTAVMLTLTMWRRTTYLPWLSLTHNFIFETALRLAFATIWALYIAAPRNSNESIYWHVGATVCLFGTLFCSSLAATMAQFDTTMRRSKMVAKVESFLLFTTTVCIALDQYKSSLAHYEAIGLLSVVITLGFLKASGRNFFILLRMERHAGGAQRKLRPHAVTREQNN